jgi:hypothetical protein
MSNARLLIAVALAVLCSAGAAQAATSVRFGLQDDAWLAAGPGPDTLPARIDVLKKLGVKVVRFNLRWDAIASVQPELASDPDDPAYDWSSADPVLNALHTAKIPVLLTIYGSPGWANGGRGPAYAPRSAASIAAFARAAATRYPWVRTWAIWNEPNEIRWLRPVSPAVYTRTLLNPAYAALHALIPGVQVAGGVTAPRGNAGGLSPLAWIAGLKAAHAHLDAYAHNPYPGSPGETPFGGGAQYGTTVTMATMPRLIAAVNQAFGRKPIWLTEYGYQTSPPDRYAGVSYAKQALYVSEAGLRAYTLPQVTMVIQFLYRDEPSLGGWQSGFQTVSGALKPSFDAFRLPLAEVSRSGARAILWGQVRPRSGRQPYRLQQLRSGRWVTLGGVRWTSGGGTLGTVVRAGGGARFRIWSPRDHAYSPTLTIV